MQSVIDALTKANAAVVGVEVTTTEDARSAETLGHHRSGSGVVIGADGLILTIGYLMLEADTIQIVTRDQRTFPARAVGYDLATGLGTPLATGLACPEVALVTPANAAAGTRVTIVGLALTHATISFGPANAHVVRRSNTSATVVVPAGTGTVVVRAADAIGHGSYHASFTYG